NNLPIINQIQGSTQINQVNLISEVCLYNDTPLDQSKNFYPFGEEPKLNDTFYIALHDRFVKPGANITLTFELSHNSNLASADITITWEIQEQGEWKKIAITQSENQLWMNSSPQLIKKGEQWTLPNKSAEEKQKQLQIEIRKTLLELGKTYRAVTEEDYKKLIFEEWKNSQDFTKAESIARVNCLPLRNQNQTNAKGHITLVVVKD
ncbi:MAG: hypothetical protein ACKN9K_23460, partial [Dolichospermum sp.]